MIVSFEDMVCSEDDCADERIEQTWTNELNVQRCTIFSHGPNNRAALAAWTIAQYQGEMPG